ncbi:unnamed protein product [Mytilus edulis]|uniref:Uncharacterized protein n=1 Tax=Mytilus edulis TaxID=6550 RepID=A0A8S3RUF0_MYTED|nr:unnamed protein product [Mytilus edulis]
MGRNTQTRRAMRRKQRAHSKAKRANNPIDWEKYKRLKANTQKETRKAHRKYIQDVVSNDFKENPKRFYTYVKSKKQESSGVSALTNTDGFLHSESSQKAEILNDQFQSVYTKEDMTSIPNRGPSRYPAPWVKSNAKQKWSIQAVKEAYTTQSYMTRKHFSTNT